MGPVFYGKTVTESASRLDDPFAQLTGSLASASRWQLEVSSVRELTPNVRRVELTAPNLGTLEYQPGQDLMLLVAVDGNRPVRRRYTIRELDRARDAVVIDVVMHGGGPGEQWIADAKAGDTIESIAPRGKVFPAQGMDWHLFVGDESAIPMVSAMIESLPAACQSLVLLEVPESADQRPIQGAGPVRTVWLARDGRPAGEATELARAVQETTLPPGRGHAYIAAEAKVVLALRDELAARGLPPERISPKAYWGRGKANGNHGEPAKE
jgi:NADPH-dependent ferric siderophore reductase